VENALKGKDVKATAKAAAAQLRTVARPSEKRGPRRISRLWASLPKWRRARA